MIRNSAEVAEQRLRELAHRIITGGETIGQTAARLRRARLTPAQKRAEFHGRVKKLFGHGEEPTTPESLQPEVRRWWAGLDD